MKKILYALIPLLIFIFILEGISIAICHYRFSPYQTNIGVQGRSRWISDPETVWANRPYYLDYDKLAQYNEKGMRVNPGNVEMPLKKPNDFWVFLLGGSAMAGMGSSQSGEWMKLTGVGGHNKSKSIDGYLEQILQRAMPNKKVRVFNAAVASSTVLQSKLHYQHVIKEMNPNWVVSMDGYNDPHELKEGYSTSQMILDYWSNHRTQNFPIKHICMIMSYSAFFYLLGEYVFFKSNLIRNNSHIPQDQAVVRQWLDHEAVMPGSIFEVNTNVDRAVDEFWNHLSDFESILNQDQQKHLLLVQPFLGLRKKNGLEDIEMALHNYYFRANDHSGLRSFFSRIYDKVQNKSEGTNIYAMKSVHQWSEWVFVDYCHFTENANERIAKEIARYILSDGLNQPFKRVMDRVDEGQ